MTYSLQTDYWCLQQIAILLPLDLFANSTFSTVLSNPNPNPNFSSPWRERTVGTETSEEGNFTKAMFCCCK